MNLNNIYNKNNTNIPMVEKWRPTNFDDIVLDPFNKIIMKNIIDTAYFPNLLFYVEELWLLFYGYLNWIFKKYGSY